MSNEIPNYDQWKLDTPDNHMKTYCTCDWCGGEIYVGEEYLETNGNRIHDDCFDEYAEETLDPRRKIAGEE